MAFEKIKEILCENFEVEEEYITPDALLLGDLGLDDLDFWDLVMDVEDVFGVEFPDDIIEKDTTVGDIIRIIEENN